jgi:hypothetical protein
MNAAMNDPNPPHQARNADRPPACRPFVAGPAPAYPLPRPTGGDRRFTVGLALDVAAVLAEHGYPRLAGGADLTHWQHTLFTGIYTNHSTEVTA